uniref:Fanconi anemia group I protein n=1 Tax=Leersia perrieri TaxID=77586 RepID=A0A0D9VTV0_9ORYZ
MSASAADSAPSSQHPPPPTAESVLRIASRDPSAAAPLLPALPPDGLNDLLSSLSPTSPPNHLALLPAALALSPYPTAVSAAFSALLSAPTWPSPTLLAVASLLRDLPGAHRHRVPAFIAKVVSLLPGADAQDLPALAYQLLLLASKPLHPRAVLSGLLRFFGGHRGARLRAPPSIARQVEGTVLMHVAFAVKQDPALAREVVAAVKADAAGTLSGFAVAVLLSVARVRRFNEAAVSVLRDAVITSRRDYRISRRCKWLPDCLKEECARAATCVEKALLKAVGESISGREHVVPSIVQVGFLLLEASDSDKREEGGSPEGIMSTEEVGLNMLKSLFEIHGMVQTEIIEQCKFRILSAKPSQSVSVIRLLGGLIRTRPFQMLEYIAHLKELLDYFAFLNDKISTGLINCILPLTKFSRDLKDYIILVVRKAMFKREDAVRIAATNAIVQLIITDNKHRKNKANPFQDSSSQPSSSQQPETHLETGGGLFQELSGLLRRCFSQQARVKEVLYDGLIQIVTSDPVIAEDVLDFLWPHFLNYYTENVPLKLIHVLKLRPPKYALWNQWTAYCHVSHVFFKFSKIVNVNDHEMHTGNASGLLLRRIMRLSSSDLFVKALSNTQKYLRKFLTEDQRGQTQETCSLSSHLDNAHCHNLAMLGIIDVFVDFAASKLEQVGDEQKEMLEKEILDLIDTHSSFERKSSKNKEKNAQRAGNSNDSTAKHTNGPKEYYSAMSQKLNERRGKFMDSNLYELVRMCVQQCNADNHEKCSQRPSQSNLNQCSSLLSFVLKACLGMFKSLAAMGSGATSSTVNARTVLYEDVKKLVGPIMQLIWWLMLDSKQEIGGTKRNLTQGKKYMDNKKDQLYLALTCLKELSELSVPEDRPGDIINVLISSAPPNFEDMVDSSQLLDRNDTDPNTRNAHVFLNILKMLYVRVLSQSLLRESEVVTELIYGISRKLHHEQSHLVGHWAEGLCRRTTVQNPSIGQEMVKLSVHLMTAPDDLVLVHNMTAELKLVASNDEDLRDSSEVFPVINCKTKNSLAAVFLQMVESSLTELDWVIGKLKGMLALAYDSANIDEDQPADERTQRLYLEEALYLRSTSVVHILSSFTHMSLKDSQAEQFLKLTAKFYKLLARMAKSQIAPKGYKQAIPDIKFQKLAEITCRMLTAPLYNFVATVQENQQASKRGILARIKRESKCIPDLIFQIEDYEKYLIQLSKLTKVNLLRHAKRSVARDFQIKPKDQEEMDSTPNRVASSENRPEEDAEDPDVPLETNADEDLQATAHSDNTVEDSESDEEEERVLARRKRAKTNNIVQDSDEEAEE